MTLLRALKALVLGETWLLPIGVTAAIVTAVVARRLLGDGWHDIGGFILFAGVAATLVASVGTGGRSRR